METKNRTLGARLKEARLNNELSQEDIAEVVSKHAVTISKYERDVQDPNTQTLSELAKAYKVSTDWLTSEHEDLIHHGKSSREKLMPVVISYPNIVVRVRQGSLSDESIALLSDCVILIRDREIRRREIQQQRQNRQNAKKAKRSVTPDSAQGPTPAQ